MLFSLINLSKLLVYSREFWWLMFTKCCNYCYFSISSFRATVSSPKICFSSSPKFLLTRSVSCITFEAYLFSNFCISCNFSVSNVPIFVVSLTTWSLKFWFYLSNWSLKNRISLYWLYSCLSFTYFSAIDLAYIERSLC